MNTPTVITDSHPHTPSIGIDERELEEQLEQRIGFPSLATMALLPLIERVAKEQGRDFRRGTIARRREDGQRIGSSHLIDISAARLTERVLAEVLATIERTVSEGS